MRGRVDRTSCTTSRAFRFLTAFRFTFRLLLSPGGRRLTFGNAAGCQLRVIKRGVPAVQPVTRSSGENVTFDEPHQMDRPSCVA